MHVIHVIGWVFIALAALMFAFKNYVVYDVARCPLGGGGVPTLDALIFPPVFATVGIWMTRASRSDSWRWWMYAVVWLCVLVVACLVFAAVDRCGTRLRKYDPPECINPPSTGDD